MLVRGLGDCREFRGGDNSILREILHPAKEDLRINYSLAWAKVLPLEATKSHRLKTSEVYYILAGKGIMHIDDESRRVSSGATIYIPRDSRQHIENTEDYNLEFLCIVDPAWRAEDEEIL